MNAPASLAHLREPQVEHLPLTAIALSETAMQAKRRGVYNEAALDELAKSIGENGLMHPVVVRKLSALRGLASYELVAGERRYLATQKLGQEHILARIVEITDAQVIKLQMVENLHREKARREREEQRIEQERTFRRALLQQVIAKWKGPLKRDDLYEIADRLLDQWEAKAIGEQFYGGKTPNVGGMSEAELVKLLIIVTASDEADQTHGKPGRLLALAKRVGIDAAKLKKSLEPKPEKPNPKTKSKR